MTPGVGRGRGGAPEGTALLMKTWSDGEAEVVRRLLLSYEIPCQVVSDVTHAVLPLSLDGLGEIRIYVPESSLEEATELLAAHRRTALESLEGGLDGGGEPDREDEGPPAPEDGTS